ncbi:MAG TPA: hypothetical protein V6C81_14070 [Planktothrix sp.]|jgi:hypothetical protein
MANADLEAKMELLAKIIEGRVVHDEDRVQVCIKGTILGFPATIEALNAGWPFGVNYFIETHVIDDPNRPQDPNGLKMTFIPRVARGLVQIFARVLLVESRGQRVGDKRLESEFIMTYNNVDEAIRFSQYPGIAEKLKKLHKYSRFSELLVKAESGLWLAQPISFKSLDPDLFRETFKMLGDIGQVLFEAF